MGGSVDSVYCHTAAIAAGAASIAHLRLNLRGADRSGQDFYHAGLVADLEAALASPELARFRHLLVLGYSLGGHMVLRYALNPSDSRVRAVAAICPPLNLSLAAEAINRFETQIYQRFLLHGLCAIYREVALRRSVPTTIAQARAVRTIREWDEATVVPRFGFQSAEDYYDQMSVAPRLPDLQLPALLVTSDQDPMVPIWSYGDALRRPLPKLSWWKLPTGGHVAFPKRQAVEQQVIHWLQGQA